MDRGRRHEHRRTHRRRHRSRHRSGLQGREARRPRAQAHQARGLHSYGTALVDVTTGLNETNFKIQTPGNNDLTRTHGGSFKTAKGFDLATGLGVPIATGVACPQILSMSHTHGAAGLHVKLTGIGLERAVIMFGPKTAKVLSHAATSAVVVVPAGSGTVRVSGTDPIGTATATASFSYS